MGLRYRKRVKILPGIYINISKSGMSTTIGPRGASVNIGKRGTYINAGIPGTGLYERQRIDNGRKSYNQNSNQLNKLSKTPVSQDIDPRVLSAIMICAGIVIAVYLSYYFGNILPFLLLAFVTLFILLLKKRKKETIMASEMSKKRRQKELKQSESLVDYQNHTSQEASNVGTVDKQEIPLKTKEETLPLDSINMIDETNVVGKEFSNQADGMKMVVGEDSKKVDTTTEGTLEPYDPKLDLEHYKYPTLDLLRHYDNIQSDIDMEEQQANKNKIIKVLSYFGFEISSIKATIGPAITLYEISPAPGISLNRIKYYEKDIALNLCAQRIRIIAPIPGKGTIGIEVPDDKPQIVSMESVISSRTFQETDFELPIALGKTITNEVFMFDLTKAPHVLIAGSTGQGKSVALNVMITSLLYKKHPAELKLILIDPRIIEFSVYNRIRNPFLAEVEENYNDDKAIISDAKTAVSTLRSLCTEIDVRYSLLQKAEAQDIKIYNKKFKNRYLNPTRGHKFMPYIVTVIDSFSDITMGYESEFKQSLTKLVKLGRAVGIHIVLATGRPSSDIVASEIKTYFPIRLSFRLPEKIDSRIILDDIGSESLTRTGDMLVYGGGSLVRVQCAYVDTSELENITSYIARQQSYNAPFPLPEVPMEGCVDEDGPDVDLNHLDPMFNEVARMVVLEQSGSTSMIQRKFSIGYNRAGRLMDQLEKVGIVGPAKGSKPREVLCVSEEELQFRLENL